MKATLIRVNGEGKVNGKVSRNVLDILTMDPDADFCECQDIVESASIAELIEIIRRTQEV